MFQKSGEESDVLDSSMDLQCLLAQTSTTSFRNGSKNNFSKVSKTKNPSTVSGDRSRKSSKTVV
jgi:hypothetical protein